MIKNRPLCVICLSVFIGIACLVHKGGERCIKALRPSPLEQRAEPGDAVNISGQVYKKEIRRQYQILYLKNNSIIHDQQPLEESRILIYVKSNKQVSVGNQIHIKGEVSFFDPPRNPGNFDQKLYYQKQDIHARIWADSFTFKNRKAWRIRDALDKFRHRWKQVLLETLGEKEGNALSAMMLGDKADMDQGLKELYQVNGIAHILAISGLHLSFIGIGAYNLLRRMSGSYAAAGICGILFLMLYIIMIGFTVSAVRALIMFLFRVGADMTGRHYDAATALSASAAAVVIWRPLSVYDGGFWLSFGAVLGIIAIFPIFCNLPAQSLWAGISINLVILPILLYCFFEFPPYSLLLNLAVIPMTSVLLALGMAGCALSFIIQPAACLVLEGCGGILSFYEWLCKIALDLPGSVVVTGQPPMAGIVFYYTGIIIALQVWRKRKILTQRRMICIVAVISAAGFVLFASGRQGNPLEITVLDVGQGDCIFIRGQSGLSCLVDGGSSNIKSVGKYRIEPYLKHQGVKTLDYVFVSHGDSDHINGIEEMIARQKTGVRIKTLVLPVGKVWDESLDALALKAAENGIRVMVAEPGNILKTESLTITCLQPGENYEGENGNAASMVLAVRYEKFDMLLTGDVEGEGEEILTDLLQKKYKGRSFEVLKAAHHGSRNSTGEEFLTRMSPKYAVISAGEDNRYGHPHPEAMDRLEQAGCQIWCTKEVGAVMLETDGEKMTVEGYKSTLPYPTSSLNRNRASSALYSMTPSYFSTKAAMLFVPSP